MVTSHTIIAARCVPVYENVIKHSARYHL